MVNHVTIRDKDTDWSIILDTIGNPIIVSLNIRVDQLLDKIDKNAHILDIGCGSIIYLNHTFQIYMNRPI